MSVVLIIFLILALSVNSLSREVLSGTSLLWRRILICLIRMSFTLVSLKLL